MSINSPAVRNWWNEPIAKVELIWICVAFLWGLIMFFGMIFWHGYGQQNLSNEAYRITPAYFEEKVDAMIEAYEVGEDAGSGQPIVHAPPGSDIYMLGRLWEWYPILELEKGKQYRLHLSSMDWSHGFSLQPVNLNLQVHPNYDMVLTLTAPEETGVFTVVCNEYCGVGHHTMMGEIRVVD